MRKQEKPRSRHPVSGPRSEPEAPEHEAGALLLNQHFRPATNPVYETARQRLRSFFGYTAVLYGKCLSTFRRNMLDPSLGDKNNPGWKISSETSVK
jgi:hypothetical protein